MALEERIEAHEADLWERLRLGALILVLEKARVGKWERVRVGAVQRGFEAHEACSYLALWERYFCLRDTRDVPPL